MYRMKKEIKIDKFNSIVSDLNEAKDRIYKVVNDLEEAGLNRDAEQLIKMLYHIEAFQNKY